jgi:hypothetical protein
MSSDSAAGPGPNADCALECAHLAALTASAVAGWVSVFLAGRRLLSTAAAQAARLALRTRFRAPWPRPAPLGPRGAGRPEELARLRGALAGLEQQLQQRPEPRESDHFIVVAGALGIGKTALVEAAAKGQRAARVDIAPSTQRDAIVAAVHAGLVSSGASSRLFIVGNGDYIARLTRWHHRFTGTRPVVYISLLDRSPNSGPCADILAAVRSLAAQGLRVIVDAHARRAAREAVRDGIRRKTPVRCGAPHACRCRSRVRATLRAAQGSADGRARVGSGRREPTGPRQDRLPAPQKRRRAGLRPRPDRGVPAANAHPRPHVGRKEPPRDGAGVGTLWARW